MFLMCIDIFSCVVSYISASCACVSHTSSSENRTFTLVVPVPMTLGIKIKRPADLSIVERLGGFLWCKGKTCIWIVQGFWKKSAELEVIFNSCWVLEIQNEVSANQRGSSTNHIGRFGGLDVISGIIGDRFIDPKE